MAQTETDAYGRGESPRPWLCPERRCSPLLNLRDGEYANITVPEPGQSWTCWGSMAEPVTFVYDGVEHTNDHNCCHYTPLKGLIRWQENPADWSSLASYYSWAHKKATARAALVLGAPRSQEADEALETSMQAIRDAERGINDAG